MSSSVSSKDVNLGEIKQVINNLGKLAESILNPHALAFIVSNSGEITFTNNGCKVLEETTCDSPIAKLIINTSKNYTNSCGEDCKYLLFILREFVHIICDSAEKDSSYTRIQLIRELTEVKHLLPAIFDEIKYSAEIHVTGPCSFVADLRSIVATFMRSRFSSPVSEVLTSLICDFVNGVWCEDCSLKKALSYVVSHFDYFCSKVLDPISASRVLKGFVICKKSPVFELSVENSKFIIVYDLSLKSVNDVSLEIGDELFVENLNLTKIYEKLIEHFVNCGIKMVLTPSVMNPNISLLCQSNSIYVFDRLEDEEIELIVSCLDITPLEKLNDPVESANLGSISSAALHHYANSCFINIQCSNPQRLLNVHHILLAAPFEPLWKEYYFECLNCLKTVEKWVNDFSPSISRVACDQADSNSFGDDNSGNVRFSNENGSRINQNLDHESKCNKDFSNETLVNANSFVACHLKLCDSPVDHNLCNERKAIEFFSNQTLGATDCTKASFLVECDSRSNRNIEKLLSINENSSNRTEVTVIGVSLPPIRWELLFLSFLRSRSEKMNLPVKTLAQKLCYVISKVICHKINIPFCSVKNLEELCAKNVKDQTSLEPVIYKEIMMCNVIDLICQLLKIEKVIAAK